MRFTLFPQVP